ncbi:MAG TPA: PQQ-binding-like beta-propeller repeat protein [Vicinamibacterales bacterium]|jgi:glucose dehydrogenase|nr:PQQ-binding-like beta-propeller repeat protein [Vicinamibacterales bacterium]
MRVKRVTIFGGLVVAACLAVALGAGQTAQERPSVVHHADFPTVNAATSSNWSQHNLDAANTRYSPLDQINTSNAESLVLKWSYDVPRPGSIREETPLVVDGVMYFNSGSTLYALDASTGTPVWTFQLEPGFAGGKRGPSYGDGNIYAIGPTEIYAVDAKSGKVVESFGDRGVLQVIAKALEFKYPGKYADIAPRNLGYGLGSTPKYFNGTLFVGTSDSDSLIAGGLVIAADARTGAIKWVFNTVPQGPADDGWELAERTWPAGGPRQGGGIWTQPAIDPGLGLIYFNSANPAPDYDGSARPGANLFTDSMIALDLGTGKLRWHVQTVHHDIWDKDAVAGPVLFDITADGRTVMGVGSSGKVCYVYLLNRETGQPLNPIVETPVPTMTDVPGETVWPTQPIPYTSRNIPQQPFCAIYPRVDDPVLAKRTRPLFHPYLANEFVITSPGQDGGSDYGGPAFSPRTGLFYVSGKNDAVSIKVKPVGGTLKAGPNSPGHFQNIAETGKAGMHWNQTIAAYEPLTGRQVWYTEFPGWTNSSLFVTAGDVIFHGAGGEGDFLAFDARSGQQIFRFPGHFGAPDAQRTGIIASPMTYRVNGKQYVSVVASSTVLTFALP